MIVLYMVTAVHVRTIIERIYALDLISLQMSIKAAAFMRTMQISNVFDKNKITKLLII